MPRGSTTRGRHDAPLLVRMPLLDGVGAAPWDAGQYRVDVLIGDGIHRISVVISNQFGDVPEPRRLGHDRARRRRRDRERPVGHPASGCSRRSTATAVSIPAASRSRSARHRRGATSRSWGDGRRDLPAARDRPRRDADVPCRRRCGVDPSARAGAAAGPAGGVRRDLEPAGSDAVRGLPGTRRRRLDARRLRA